MADDVYKDDVENRELGFPDYLVRKSASESAALFGGGVWDDEASGFRARAYVNTKTGEITIAFAGSADAADWKNNAQQAVTANSRQYEFAQALGKLAKFNGAVRTGSEMLFLHRALSWRGIGNGCGNSQPMA